MYKREIDNQAVVKNSSQHLKLIAIRVLPTQDTFFGLFLVSLYCGAALGAQLSHAAPTVKKYLGMTLLPHSGVSLVLTGIAISSLTGDYSQYGDIVQGTIAAAAVINEIIAVFVARQGFKLAGEMGKAQGLTQGESSGGQNTSCTSSI